MDEDIVSVVGLVKKLECVNVDPRKQGRISGKYQNVCGISKDSISI
jgi:hypothetical protein